MDDTSLEHYGVKGMRWGRRDNDAVGPNPVARVISKVSQVRTSKGPKPTTAAKSAPAAPSRSFGPINRPPPSPTRSFQSVNAKPMPSAGKAIPPVSAKSRAIVSRPESKLTPEQRAHRKKMILGGIAVVGVLSAVAVYKGSPHAMAAMSNLSAASQAKVAGVMAHPKIMDLKLAGNQKVSKAKLNVLFKQAEFAERGSKTAGGIFAKEKVAAIKANPAIARAGIGQNLHELRRDTEQMRVMNDAEQYIDKLVSNRSNSRFADEAKNLSRVRAAAMNKNMATKVSKEDILKLDGRLGKFNKQQNKRLIKESKRAIKGARKAAKNAKKSIPPPSKASPWNLGVR